ATFECVRENAARGADISFAQNAAQAREQMVSRATALLVADERLLAAAEGVDLLGHARTLNPDVLVVLLSPWLDEMGGGPPAASGWRYVAKPLRPAELAVTLDSGLEIWRLRRERRAAEHDRARAWSALAVLQELAGGSGPRTFAELVGELPRAL